MNLERYMFVVSYDGSNYAGFQRQTNANSIQEEIEKAFKNMTSIKLMIHSAGRTDKGVHALNQTFHVDLPFLIEDINIFINGINKRLPSDIIIKKIKAVSNTFHARHNAKMRIYQYVIAKSPSNIFNQRFEIYIKDFDIQLAKLASYKFCGTKDFAGFAKTNNLKTTIRHIESFEIKETKTHYYFNIKGVSFLRYMVRSIMGTIIEVATNKLDISVIDEIFETNNRKLAGKTAPSKALFLKRVIY